MPGAIRLPCQAVGNLPICGTTTVVTNYCVMRDEGRLEAFLAEHPELRQAAETYLATHCPPPPPDWCQMRADGTLEAYLDEHPNLREVAMAYVVANCPTWCEVTVEAMETYVDEHPDQADEVLAYMEAECETCETTNWLRGFIAARDDNEGEP